MGQEILTDKRTGARYDVLNEEHVCVWFETHIFNGLKYYTLQNMSALISVLMMTRGAYPNPV
jgi:hypothetical protein